MNPFGHEHNTHSFTFFCYKTQLYNERNKPDIVNQSIYTHHVSHCLCSELRSCHKTDYPFFTSPSDSLALLKVLFFHLPWHTLPPSSSSSLSRVCFRLSSFFAHDLCVSLCFPHIQLRSSFKQAFSKKKSPKSASSHSDIEEMTDSSLPASPKLPHNGTGASSHMLRNTHSNSLYVHLICQIEQARK